MLGRLGRLGREVIALGWLIGAGRRGKQDIADYVLFYHGQKLAVIDAKKRGLQPTVRIPANVNTQSGPT